MSISSSLTLDPRFQQCYSLASGSVFSLSCAAYSCPISLYSRRPWPRCRTHLTVAVASQLRDESDVVIPDLDHLLTDVVLGADAALSACPPGEKTTGLVHGSRLQALSWERLLLRTSSSRSSDNTAGSPGWNQIIKWLPMPQSQLCRHHGQKGESCLCLLQMLPQVFLDTSAQYLPVK